MKIRCETCKEFKHDTAFEFKKKRFLYFWEIWEYKLDTSKCLDCKYPNRWDKVREVIKEQFNLIINRRGRNDT